MATQLTEEQTKNFQNQIGQISSSIKSLYEQRGLQYPGTSTLPAATPPSSADQINNVPSLNIPTPNYTAPDTSRASSSFAGFTAGNKSSEQLIQENVARQEAELKARATEQKSTLSSLLGGTAKAREEARTGVSDEQQMLKEDLAKRRQLEAEANSLQEDYDKTVERRDAAIAAAEQAQGGTVSGAEQAIRKIEKDYATILNSKATALKSKAAYIQVVQGNVEEARGLINEAVEASVADYTADLAINLKMYEENSGLLDKIDSAYSTAFTNLLAVKKTNLDNAREDAKTKATLMVDLAKEGIDASAYMSGNYSYQDMAQAFAGKLAATNAGGGFDSTLIPNGQAYTNAFNSAVLNLPMASQKIAQQTFANYLNNGNLEGANQYLISMATSGLPAADRTQALGRAQATMSLKEIGDLLDEAKQRGASTDLVSGSLVNIAGKLGATTNEDLAYIGARIQQQVQVYRRSMTGVAFSPQESAEYAKIFPDITNVETLNSAKLKALTDSFDANNRSTLGFLLGGQSNYEQIFGETGTPSLPSLTPKDATAELDAIVNPQTTEVGSGGWWNRFTSIFGF